MTTFWKKRILVLVGAGASVDFGIPQTRDFTAALENELRNNQYCVKTGGLKAYEWVKSTLEEYYGAEPWEAHFERVYHSLHELAAMNHIDGAVPKYKPVLYPFLRPQHDHTNEALRAAANAMLEAIYKIASTSSNTPKLSLAPLSAFIEGLKNHGVPRIYTTNYDDFFSQACPGLFTGFTNKRDEYSLFSPKDYWEQWDTPGLFHLHGSVHFGFPLSIKRDPDVGIGDLGWYESKEEAIRHARGGGSGSSRLDGTQLERSAIITGLDKLGRLQQAPYLSYYGGLTREAIEADLIIVLGSGLGDLHLNSCLLQARRTHPPTPIVYVGWWKGGDLREALRGEITDQTIAMVHDLRIDIGSRHKMRFEAYPGWTINGDTKAAVYAKGFYDFLENPATFAQVLKEIQA
ncbi:SIR2 family protein [Pseudomonas sp. F8002]|uniref:SIR2 family protein n=1 Tax=Pseudomonas sp. F8002 TaxID=2738822 RepID=UPI0015A041B8|nr:SIR2 family protein [Pseudomonas sp. F8002]NWB52245.1 SIR2 family protein [Pseudomonas sp. F8002]